MEGEEAVILKVSFHKSPDRRPGHKTQISTRPSLCASLPTQSNKTCTNHRPQVDLFLSELERRLTYLETYSDLSLDTTLSRAYQTLQAVRTRCSQASSELLGEGRRRAHIMVETLETRYASALAAADSTVDKARVSIELLDEMLSDFESRAHKLRERGLQAVVNDAAELAGRVVEDGLRGAKQAAEGLEETIQKAMLRAKEHGLIRYEDLPVPWRINPHILRGYRFRESTAGCIRSAFGLSNELVNIWSHALGLLLILSVAFYFYPTSINFHLSTKADVFIAAVFFFAACQCLVCSTIWHTMNAITDVHLISTFACVDYTGISLLIAASIMTTEYTAFYCEPVSRWLYMVLTAVLGVAGVVMPWNPAFNGPDMAWARVAFFIGLGATGFVPIVQLTLSRGSEFVWEFYSPIAKSMLVYIVGAFVYASKVPERWCPGMFDYFGGSHNLWHIAVLGGILFHYTAMQEFFSLAFQRAQGGCPAY